MDVWTKIPNTDLEFCSDINKNAYIRSVNNDSEVRIRETDEGLQIDPWNDNFRSSLVMKSCTILR